MRITTAVTLKRFLINYNQTKKIIKCTICMYKKYLPIERGYLIKI